MATQYVITNSTMTWRGKTYEVGQTYELSDSDRGWINPATPHWTHENPLELLFNLKFDDHRLFRVNVLDSVKLQHGGLRANKMEIAEEITGEEKSRLLSGTLRNEIGFFSYLNGKLHDIGDQPAYSVFWNGTFRHYKHGVLQEDDSDDY